MKRIEPYFYSRVYHVACNNESYEMIYAFRIKTFICGSDMCLVKQKTPL